jgi:twitching motility protein PilT
MDITALLEEAASRGASDVHVRSDSAPYIRIDGELIAAGTAVWSAAEVESVASGLMTSDQRETFLHSNEVDFAVNVSGVGRFRANVFRARGQVGIALRLVRPGTPSFEALGLPPVVRTLADERRGLILVTGMTGSGKTTTTAAMLGHINMTRRCHIITIEDPIEVMHTDKMAIVDQREIGIDTSDFHSALKYAMRQDPDVIFIGEMRDVETVSAAIRAAETGHLVISTMHTIDATETVNRVVDFFPPHQQMQARLSLASSLRGIVSQRLVPRADANGRVPAMEILVSNGRIFDMIVNPDQTHLMMSVIEEGDYYGMRSFDQHLMALIRDGVVTFDDAVAAATSPHDLRVRLRQTGLA